MTHDYILAFDVGGTYIKAGVLNAEGAVVDRTLTQYEARSSGSEAEILNHFTAIVKDLIHRLDHEHAAKICGIGYAFPGPFDYEKGISYIRGLNKFDDIYGINIGERLKERFHRDPAIAGSLTADWKLVFENDASSFALGEAVYEQASATSRVVCMTIGTGLGSGFVEEGQLVKHRQDVPDKGWLYPIPYEKGMADDYVSRRGLLALAAQLGIELTDSQDVKELAEMAYAGNEQAVQLFRRFGSRMADIVGPSLREFQPDVVVLGGQISKSGDLFVPAFISGLREQGVTAQVKLSENTQFSTFRGIYHLIMTG